MRAYWAREDSDLLTVYFNGEGGVSGSCSDLLFFKGDEEFTVS